MRNSPLRTRKAHWISVVLLVCLGLAACIAGGQDRVRQRMWWSGLGPVLPHDSFPADCSLCHVGGNWTTLSPDFRFDHEAETGVALNGAHAQASCLRCHNDRGPVAVFARQGCGGCHEDVHIGRLGSTCANCHVEHNWAPVGQIEMHRKTRFPLIGVHASTSCRRCHPGAEVGQFVPTDTECVTCHVSDLQRAVNPNHVALGWTQRCDRCHLPRTWNDAELDN
jgi:hypothetical protein